MTYLDWGCDPLGDECGSCLDAICNACNEQYRKAAGRRDTSCGLEEVCHDAEEPDCDHCELEKKPDCSRCTIVLSVCRNCRDHATCECRICE